MRISGILAPLAALLLIGSAGAAPNPEHKFELAAKYYTECKNVGDGDFDKIRPYLTAFTDMEVMAQTLADPQRLFELMAVINDPRTLHVMAKCSTEPVMWNTWMRGLTDFNKYIASSMVFMSPQTWINWAMAPMNPGVWNAMFSQLDPQRYVQWVTSAFNPQFYAPMLAPMDPAWYGPRVQWLAAPQNWTAFQTAKAPAAGEKE